MPAALRLVQQELGPDATVLSTRKKPDGLLGRLVGSRTVEVTASGRVPDPVAGWDAEQGSLDPHVETEGWHALRESPVMPAEINYREQFKQFAAVEQSDSFLEEMMELHHQGGARDLPARLFQLFTDLLESDVDHQFARELVEQIQQHLAPAELQDGEAVQKRLKGILQQRIRTTRPITASDSKRRVVALIGPTGVGKTTTIAKLAANLRLRDKHRVGLITVDTYRIAAVDQLRAVCRHH